MPSGYKIAHFRLEKLISENNLTQSWYATDLKAGRRCFVKLPARNPDIDPDSVNSILMRSFNCQKRLWSRKLLTAVSKHSEDGKLLIVYPYLELSRWKILTPTLFWQRFPHLLLETAIVIDYLHLTGLVHGDLKLGNVLVNCSHQVEQVKLIDLDLLTFSHSSPDAKILGTPGHVAPEILDNDLITTESDNYSIGVSLKAYVRALEEEASLRRPKGRSYSDNLAALADSLTKADRLVRPRVLVEALFRHELIDSQAFESGLKRLLAMRLSTSLRNHRVWQTGRKTSLGGFLVKDTGVFGLPEDLATDLDLAFKKNQAATLLLFKMLIQKAIVVLIGDYWQLTLPDELCVALFARAENILHGEDATRFTRKTGTTEDRNGLVAKALELKTAESFLKSFLCLKHALGQIDPADVWNEKERKRILFELGHLAEILNRPKEGIHFFSLALDMIKDSSKEHFDLILNLIRLHLMSKSFRKAEELIDGALAKASCLSDRSYQLRLLMSKAWVLAARGEYAESGEMYETLVTRATESNLVNLMVELYNGLGTLMWRRGNLSRAKEYLKKSIKLAKQNNLLSIAVTPYRNLSLVCYELSEYKKTVQYGKLALRVLVKPSDAIKLPFIYSTIALAYTRFGSYRKAEYWLRKSIANSLFVQDRMLFGEYYQFFGWLQANAGRLEAAKESLHKTLEILCNTTPNKTIGKTYQVLAEIALYEGDHETCICYVEKARGIFQQLRSEPDCAETKLLAQMNEYYHTDNEQLSSILPLLESLISHKCRYHAVLCLFYILVHSNSILAQIACEKASGLLPLIEKPGVPLYSAVRGLIAWHRTQLTEQQMSLGALKNAYKSLQQAGHTFLASLVCEKIAAEYTNQSNSKLSKKFYTQSLKLSEQLHNKRLIKSYSERIKSLSRSDYEHQQLVQSIHGISEIFQSMTDYESSLQKVIQYAVDETGAERGVLLLKADNKSGLQIKASVGCDEPSLADITDFSSTIPKDVASDLRPLVIENALIDKRTREYKSIVTHNILSVICLPITIRGKALGVLYLDHHTIPALFEPEDITFVSSIANFISIILTKIREFRSTNLDRDRLLGNLSRLGFQKQLVTHNQVMLDLLSKLPEIARTNASILIVGESGTGKEILAEMIYDLSLRSEGPLVKLNCAAIPGTLIESELFGVAKNVATGVGEREGKFSAADGGTLFLDEIGDMPLEIQAKVLRVLEYQQFERVGSNRTITTDIRFIYATNKDLTKLIGEGKFRQDLYYRINTITITVPPLRERPDDIMLLVKLFARLYTQDEPKCPRLSAGAIETLLAYPWPGNVRELRNLVERLCILRPGKLVQISDLPKEFLIQQTSDDRSRRVSLAVEKTTIRVLLVSNGWNQSKVARIMNIPLTTLRRKIKKYHITKEF